MRIAQKGRKPSRESIEAGAAKRRSHYNGLNGYGHTKRGPGGYILVYVPEHPRAHKDGYLFLHTVIVERALNRYLAKDEVVHHINHIRDDNRIENLLLMNRKEHMTMHMRERNSKRRDNH